MLIGIPKEIKNNENRVALTPAGVHSLVGRGHRVLIETNAGLGSGFTDADYQKQGAEIVATAAEAWAAELVVVIASLLKQMLVSVLALLMLIIKSKELKLSLLLLKPGLPN